MKKFEVEADNKVTCEKENSNSEKSLSGQVNVKTEGNMGADVENLINGNQNLIWNYQLLRATES